MRAKVCPHVNRTRTPHPHRETAPAQMSPHKFSPQLRLQHLQLVFLGPLSCKVFLGAGLFFRPGRILIFCRQVNNLILKLFSKKALLKVFVHVFLRKKSKFEKKKLLRFLEVEKKNFFSPQSAVENKTHFFWSQSISEWRNLFFTQNGEMAKWRRNQCWPKKVGKHWKRNMMLILGVFGTIQKYAIAFLRFLLVLPFSFSRFWQRLQTANEPLAAWVEWLLLGGPPLQLTMLTSGSHSAISYRKSADF